MRKKCSTCKKTKPFDDFDRKVSRRDGRNSRCKSCYKERRNTPERLAAAKAYQKSYWLTPNGAASKKRGMVKFLSKPTGRASMILYSSKKYAKRSGYLPISLNAEELAAWIESQPTVCAGCGIEESDCKRRHAVDHDHATGRVRALLCRPCNMSSHLPSDVLRRLADIQDGIGV
jgi:hypothetical protein